MYTMLKKSSAIKLLDFLIKNPEKEFHIRELVKKVRISPVKLKEIIEVLDKIEAVNVRKRGNMKLVRINRSNIFARKIVELLLISAALESGVKDCISSGSVAIIGSWVTFSHNSKSDVDFLVVSDEKPDLDPFKKFEEIFGKKADLVVVSELEWLEMMERRDPFYLESISAHIALRGSI